MKQKQMFTAGDLVERIRSKYSDPRYLVLNEVPSSTGVNYTTIDVMVIDMWPSGGFQRSAFEIKVSRQDFLHEIMDPLKNKWFRTHCHSFWYVAPEGVIKEGEVPENCGWLKPRGKGLSVAKVPMCKEDPVITDGFLCSLLRAIGKEHVRTKVEVVKNDASFQSAKIWEKACRRFLLDVTGENYYSFDEAKEEESVNEVIGFLKEASPDKRIKRDREQIISQLNLFRDKLRGMTSVFLLLANIGFLETDKMGDFLVKSWGGTDNLSLAMQRQLSRGKKKFRSEPCAKQFVELMEFLKKYMGG